jgi:FkbM family methyltransferase
MSSSAPPGWMLKLRSQRAIVQRLGIRGWLSYRYQDLRLAKAAAGEELDVPTALAKYPLKCRAQTSDHYAFAQVFVNLAYAAVPKGQTPSLVVDCGANAGYSAAYFLSRFDQCRVIAIEPDADNYRLLEKNLAKYGDRALCVHGALWSHPTHLRIIEQAYRGGGFWARQVEECAAGSDGALAGFDIPTLLDRAAADRISILKMDIEGAEAVVFGSGKTGWIDQVDTIMIELHDDTIFGDSTPIFHNAIAGRGFNVRETGELTICVR